MKAGLNWSDEGTNLCVLIFLYKAGLLGNGNNHIVNSQGITTHNPRSDKKRRANAKEDRGKERFSEHGLTHPEQQ